MAFTNKYISDNEQFKFVDDGEGNPAVRSQLNQKKVLVDEATSSITYVCLAAPGSLTSESVWQIMKIETSGNITNITFADGDKNYDNVADDRASLSYS